jgi:ElaB/YqjD/DUF883 family membrane-anchored ribosome-binding protein
MTETQDNGRLAEDLRTLVDDAESLLKATTNVGSAELQQRAQASLADLRTRLSAIEVDSYVRDNPWQAVAIAGGVALLLGLVMGRR